MMLRKCTRNKKDSIKNFASLHSGWGTDITGNWERSINDGISDNFVEASQNTIHSRKYLGALKDNGLFQTRLLNFIQFAKTLLLLGVRQKLMIPSCCPWKVVTFFGKNHVNWSTINEVMIGRSWKINFGKLKIGVTKKIIDFFELDFST